MKNRIIYIFITVLFLSSCNNWLNITPKSRIDRETNFETEDGFKRALIGCYSKLKDKNLYGSKLTMTTIEYLAQNWEIQGSNTELEALIQYEYSNSSVKNNFQTIYASLYNVIVQANDILQHISTNGDVFASPEAKDMIEAEALAIRAFCHLDVLRLFGQMPNNAKMTVDLPYVEAVSRELNLHISYKEYTAKIEKDLLKAEELLKNTDAILNYSYVDLNRPYYYAPELKDEFFAYRKYRFNFYAVKATQARFYLYIGERQLANSAANMIIEAKTAKGIKQHTLAGAADFSSQNYALPSECIIALNSVKMDEYVDPLFRNGDNMIGTSMKKVFETIFEEETTNNRYTSLWYEYTKGNGSKLTTLKKYWQDNTADDENDTDTEIENRLFYKQIIPLLRVSEMYLILIETTSDLNTANQLMVEYKNARNVIYTPSEDRAGLDIEILKEYRREFYAEGQLFFAYKRLGTYNILWYDKPMQDAQYVIPLPSTEISASK